MNRLKLALVSCLFLGCSPFAPGTFGTLGGVAIAWLLSGTELFPVWTLLACGILYAASQPLGAWAEAYARKKDPGIFVIDEVIGYLLTVIWFRGPSPLALLVAFFVFRFFDIVKPPPIRQVDAALKNGAGVMADDFVAAFYTLLVLAIGQRLFGG